MGVWGRPYRDEKEMSGCGIVGIMNERGDAFSGGDVAVSICNMMDRGNGLGAGFAGYGIYPDFKDCWCFHVMYQEEKARELVEQYLKTQFILKDHGPIPTNRVKTLRFIPLLWKYFFDVRDEVKDVNGEQDYVIECVMEINRHIEGALVFSSGKNMGIFKGVGYPENIGRF